MEKLLRYLNPKTVNFDAMPSGGQTMFTTSDACLTLSYARLTPIQDQLVKCYALNQNSVDKLKHAAKFIHAEFIFNKMAESGNDHEISIFIALVEICAVPVGYKPSTRNRSVIGAVTHWKIRKDLMELVNKYKSDLLLEIERLESKIDACMNK
ncbi:hypothetical protein ACX1NY_11295 [Acinetobacter sp. ANC 4631]